jgi:hypothetical protein
MSGTSGINGTPGSNGTSGINGTPGSNGTSGISGTSGVSGTPGTPGSNGTSGKNGTSGTSGPAGSPGPAGTSGTSGGGASSEEYWTIASHSGIFNTAPFSDLSVFYMGNDKCGWDSCDYNLTQYVKGEADPLQPQYINVGIPNPIRLVAGDVVSLCGMGYAPGSESSNSFGVSLSLFRCSSPLGQGGIQVFPLANDYYPYENDKQTVCFGLTYTVPSTIADCDFLFIVGLNSYLTQYTDVKFTWQLSVTRPAG